MIKRYLWIVSIFIIIFTATALVYRPKQKSLEKVTVLLDWFPNTNHTGLYVAAEKKYFKDAGLEVEIIQPSEGENIQIVAAGKADFAVSSQEVVTLARAEDIPIISIAAVIQHNTSAFVSLKESNIKSVRDFEGKKYGGWGSPIEEAVLRAVMTDAGADYLKLKNVTIGTTDFFTTIGRNSDFQWIFYGWDGIEAKHRGIDLNLIQLKDLDPVLDYYTPVIVTNEKSVNNRRDLVKKFTLAAARGYVFAIDHPQEAAEILIKNVPEIKQDLVKESQKWLSSQYRADKPKWGRQEEAVWQRYADWLFDHGLLKKKIEGKSAFTNEFLP
ncbi:MAG: NMT1/THI5 like protein domain protein [Candidatus Gottesmanbacteria bacterium GW2011_GWA2_42_18]|uniref:NMT1/THI5 like protein domain protein n=1 Tax=Candidatus Gottesmanbacteria bacterium GW2011_GWA2_42_18 TaxID=1618442 RepID=A0A0G0ZC08_9BACT|nr:MAG: NMT1/THI5 like protein domain protein [Candidatus Gottesmanbacteria bacterium GW2011_GWA2_42_18]